MADTAIVRRWQARLVVRLGLLAAARRRHSWRPTNASRKLVAERRRQVEEAQRVIARHADGRHVSAPVVPILQHSWGYHPPVHDGVDLITEGNDVLYALCDGTVIDARSTGWWGKGAKPSSGHSVSDGDGIIRIRCDVDAGPFKPGMVFSYGHAEKATVRVGQKVKAGQKIGHAGFANAWHVHFMASDHDIMGRGDRDPWPYVDYACKHAA